MLSSILSVSFAIIIVFPFIVTFSALTIYKKRGKAPVKMLGEAADWTTPFLFLSVYIVTHAIFDVQIGFHMMLTFVLLVIVFAIFERVTVKDFRIIRLMRKIWRISFMLLLVTYIGLVLTGLALQVLAYTY